MRRTRQSGWLSPVAAGMVALLVVSAATYMGFAKRLPWSGDWEMQAVLTSANELHPNSPVRIAGVDVGRVKRVERGPGRTAVVTLAIADRGRPIHRDATLKVRPRIFLEGNFFVDLRPGTPGSPELEEGGTIPVSQTATPVQLDEILSTLNSASREQLKTVVREYARALDEGGAEALNSSYPDWERAFKGTAQVFEAFRGREEDDLSSLVADQARIAAALASRREELRDLVTNFNRTVSALASRQAEVGASLRGLAALLRAAFPALGEINRSFPALRAFTADLRPGLREAPETLTLSLPLLRQLAGLVAPGEAPRLVADLRPALRSLTRLQPDLVSLLRRVTPVTECVRTRALPVLDARLDDGPLSSGQPVWLEFLHGMVGLASASQSFDGNGYSVRYHGGYGDQLFSTGKVAGYGTLYGLAPEPVLGSRPAWPGPGTQPPFRPDVPCETQAVPNLAAATRGAPPSQPGQLLPLPAQVQQLLDQLLGVPPSAGARSKRDPSPAGDAR